jgi:hypothetical protein
MAYEQNAGQGHIMCIANKSLKMLQSPIFGNATSKSKLYSKGNEEQMNNFVEC